MAEQLPNCAGSSDDGFAWYYSFDQEIYWPALSREDAIEGDYAELDSVGSLRVGGNRQAGARGARSQGRVS